MTTPASPEVVPARAGLLVWIVPVIALLVGGYLLFKEFSGRGPMISITFADGSGVEAGKTPILHRGVVVGTVEEVALREDLETAVVRARLHQSAASLARAETRFWIARPSISADGIQDLDTLVRGVHLEVQPGGGDEARAFEGLSSEPVATGESHRYILHSPRRNSIRAGVAVRFRGIEVGQVESVALAPDATEVRIHVAVRAPYHRLVREGTVFWNAGGVDMKVGLLGAHIRTGSLQSVLAGAIAFATPPDATEKPIAQSGSHFELQPSEDEDWLKWNPVIDLPLVEAEG